jgi:uncharacterized membrane protein YebE (DUF533 family)
MGAGLPPHLRATAYALAAVVAASYLPVLYDERYFLALLAGELQLDDLVCAALQRTAHARHKSVG